MIFECIQQEEEKNIVLSVKCIFLELSELSVQKAGFTIQLQEECFKVILEGKKRGD